MDRRKFLGSVLAAGGLTGAGAFLSQHQNVAINNAATRHFQKVSVPGIGRGIVKLDKDCGIDHEFFNRDWIGVPGHPYKGVGHTKQMAESNYHWEVEKACRGLLKAAGDADSPKDRRLEIQSNRFALPNPMWLHTKGITETMSSVVTTPGKASTAGAGQYLKDDLIVFLDPGLAGCYILEDTIDGGITTTKMTSGRWEAVRYLGMVILDNSYVKTF